MSHATVADLLLAPPDHLADDVAFTAATSDGALSSDLRLSHRLVTIAGLTCAANLHWQPLSEDRGAAAKALAADEAITATACVFRPGDHAAGTRPQVGLSWAPRTKAFTNAPIAAAAVLASALRGASIGVWPVTLAGEPDTVVWWVVAIADDGTIYPTGDTVIDDENTAFLHAAEWLRRLSGAHCAVYAPADWAQRPHPSQSTPPFAAARAFDLDALFETHRGSRLSALTLPCLRPVTMDPAQSRRFLIRGGLALAALLVAWKVVVPHVQEAFFPDEPAATIAQEPAAQALPPVPVHAAPSAVIGACRTLFDALVRDVAGWSPDIIECQQMASGSTPSVRAKVTYRRLPTGTARMLEALADLAPEPAPTGTEAVVTRDRRLTTPQTAVTDPQPERQVRLMLLKLQDDYGATLAEVRSLPADPAQPPRVTFKLSSPYPPQEWAAVLDAIPGASISTLRIEWPAAQSPPQVPTPPQAPAQASQPQANIATWTYDGVVYAAR